MLALFVAIVLEVIVESIVKCSHLAVEQHHLVDIY
jgi:hypothetical protein